tara:strand:+ start:166 stop:522 length:357 start_codon:yes stop_codon:yes gene_type:complete
MGKNKSFQKTYITLLRINMFLYLFTFLGIFSIPSKYTDDINLFLKTIVSLFLIIRFNPYTKTKFSEMDKRIVFSAALFLFSTTTLNSIIKHYTVNQVDKVKNNKSFKTQFNFKDFHVF